jgi:hypothetical protein
VASESARAEGGLDDIAKFTGLTEEQINAL